MVIKDDIFNGWPGVRGDFTVHDLDEETRFMITIRYSKLEYNEVKDDWGECEYYRKLLMIGFVKKMIW